MLIYWRMTSSYSAEFLKIKKHQKLSEILISRIKDTHSETLSLLMQLVAKLRSLR